MWQLSPRHVSVQAARKGCVVVTDKMEAKDVNLWLWASNVAVRHAAEAILFFR